MQYLSFYVVKAKFSHGKSYVFTVQKHSFYSVI